MAENDTIKQLETKREIAVPADAADKAINVRVEGWTIPVELRIVIQVYPKDAPAVVAPVGTIEDVDNRIVTPAIRDIFTDNRWAKRKTGDGLCFKAR